MFLNIYYQPFKECSYQKDIPYTLTTLSIRMYNIIFYLPIIDRLQEIE